MNENKDKELSSLFTCSSKKAAQLSGMILLGLFFVFCFGYSVGYRRAIQDSLRGIQKESLAQEVYANAFFVNNPSQSPEERDQEELFQPEDYQEISKDESPKRVFTARLIGYPILHKINALQFVEKWKKRGINLFIKEYGNNKSKDKRWVQVLMEPNEDKAQVEFLANIISEEEKLADVVVELYSSEEKTI